jgi:UDP-N-acetylmuramoyl-tripeptide--D-alanyl-D-alanine ligase
MLQPIKRSFRNIFAGVLGIFARSIIRKYKPQIVMVTGSVGKTSTKDAVAAVLAGKFFLRKSEKSFNSEFGVPLTIIGAKNPWTSVIAWLNVFGEAIALLMLPNHYPKLLVLEVGADWPGDLEKILKIAKPDAVVVTLLPSVPVHVEAYETPAAVREEEFAPALALPAGAPLIISADDEFAAYRASTLNVTIKTFGTNKDAMVHIKNVHVMEEDKRPCGMKGELEIAGKTYPIHVKGAFGRSQLYAPAAAVAAALSLGMTAEEAIKGLDTYVPPPGRARIFNGKHGSILIDDTYNSSPIAVEEVLNSLDLIPHGKRYIAVLGDMLELGRYSVAEHTRIGHIAQETVDVIITVGQRARAIGEAAQLDGMSEDMIYSCTTAAEAIEILEGMIREGDIVLVKASQSIRLEKVMKALLANPGDSSELVRQDAQWQKR